MSNREKCLMIIDDFTEEQLSNILILLESVKALAEEAVDDSFCLRLYSNYIADTDKDDMMSLEDFAASLDVDLA